METTTNDSYSTPVLQELGSIEEITLGSIQGEQVDPDMTAEFPRYLAP